MVTSPPSSQHGADGCPDERRVDVAHADESEVLAVEHQPDDLASDGSQADVGDLHGLRHHDPLFVDDVRAGHGRLQRPREGPDPLSAIGP